MARNNDLMDGMEGVELSDEELAVQRSAQADEHNALIIRLDKQEAIIRERIAGLSNEIEVAYANREAKIKALEDEVSARILELGKSQDYINGLIKEREDVLAALTDDKIQFKAYKEQTEAELNQKKQDLDKESERLEKINAKLDLRLNNIKMREDSLHQIIGG